MGKVTKNQKAADTAEALAVEEDKKKEALCNKFAEDVLQIMAKHKPRGAVTNSKEDHKEMLELYGPMQIEVTRLAMERGLTIGQVGYSMSIVQSFIVLLSQLTENSLKQSFDVAERKVWGFDPSNLTVDKLDAILNA